MSLSGKMKISHLISNKCRIVASYRVAVDFDHTESVIMAMYELCH